MGRIKTKAIKRVALGIFEKEPEIVSEDFGTNKKMLGDEMSSKKVRNIVAGYLTRLKRNNKNIIE